MKTIFAVVMCAVMGFAFGGIAGELTVITGDDEVSAIGDVVVREFLSVEKTYSEILEAINSIDQSLVGHREKITALQADRAALVLKKEAIEAAGVKLVPPPEAK